MRPQGRHSREARRNVGFTSDVSVAVGVGYDHARGQAFREYFRLDDRRRPRDTCYALVDRRHAVARNGPLVL
jgi:hypothetical protein